MRLNSLRHFALALPGATANRQWGDELVFKVAGKMFFVISLDGEALETVAFKCSPTDYVRLCEIDGIRPAPYLARAQWVQLQDLAALTPRALEAQIVASYDLVRARLSKTVRSKLPERKEFPGPPRSETR